MIAFYVTFFAIVGYWGFSVFNLLSKKNFSVLLVLVKTFQSIVLLGVLVLFYLFLQLLFRLRATQLQSERDIADLATTVGRAAPVLRRIDDRGRAVLQDSNQLLAVTPTSIKSFSVLVRDENDAKHAIQLFSSVDHVFDRLILVLDWESENQWGNWVENDFGPNITVIAGEHLLDGSADPSSLIR
ncbi:hypothetical protein BK816_00430 [Boudabousia tangfeifanii]|uniref:Uncharacterized protein n=1 Tax=Boudabousia tangfeifanii TaxID=1912795 RepID=A0A1D9MI11_9ACTO|nr:hypothetical protein [Boudabousia tangfeifanii]AOZ71945.1 hypothetical protein BK816_00430 [Boudabousia tangfeifanii]